MHRRYPSFVNSTAKYAELSSPVFVSSEYESIDYERYTNEIVVQEEEHRGNLFLASIVVQRILLFLCVGIFCGLCGCIMDFLVHYGCLVRHHHLHTVINDYFDKDMLKVYVVWTASVVIPAVFGCIMVVYGEPKASGGGVTWCMGYLNGINLDTYMTFRVLMVKMSSCVLCVISGLPGGKEGPLIHIGTIVGTLMPFLGFGKKKPFDYFQQEPEKRDMSAAGSAGGLTAAFASPLAGLMLSFEEGLSFWTVELTFLIFICTMTSFYSLRLFTKLFIELEPSKAVEEVDAPLGVLQRTQPNHFYLFEVVVYVLLGAITGMLGALWNYFGTLLILLRKRFMTTPERRFLELIVLSVVIGVIQVLIFTLTADVCAKRDPKGPYIDPGEDNHVKLRCKDSEIPVVSLFFLQTPLNVLRSFFTEDESPLGIAPLFYFVIYNFIGSCVLNGCGIAHGIFIPHVLTGTAWGRLVAEVIQHFYPEAKVWASPNKFAFLCGAAQLSGSLHIPFTISVMMLEICNISCLSIPIFICVCAAKFFSSFMSEAMYHIQSSHAGLPLLDKDAPPNLEKLSAKNVMVTPVVTVPISTNYRTLYNILKESKHHGFPVVEADQSSLNKGLLNYGQLKGLIRRSEIVTIINNKLTADSLKNKEMFEKIRREFTKDNPIDERMVNKYENTEVNLGPFMNPAPHIIDENASLSRAYRLFTSLGLRHLVVVNNDLTIVGVITRQDLSVFRYHLHFCRAKTEILPVR